MRDQLYKYQQLDYERKNVIVFFSSMNLSIKNTSL